ncbi:similar to methyltransferase GidB [Chondrus crispus]|uniref:Similar to methyltransferase GidB n=1 Tax=Chondrus crispus TaxID=2769 RepID=R7QST8_CHOCR|nr:similar to methyltransferase GidB [Chondrus crispus]CDF40571.1 similar to methyltransferase GidB [Chondrus crispus]|eukprot:XP_005710865.1 similar to methyltransferase GidB [Chondrus crispus]
MAFSFSRRGRQEMRRTERDGRVAGESPKPVANVDSVLIENTHLIAPALAVLRHAADSQRLDVARLNALVRLTDLLLSESKRYNLTAIPTRDAVLLKHVVDALSLPPALDAEAAAAPGALRVVDIGTGAGFPGLVLAIARPQWDVTLLEAARKKTRFHDLVRRDLALPSVASVWEEGGGRRVESDASGTV